MSNQNQHNAPSSFQTKGQNNNQPRFQNRWLNWLGWLGRKIEAIVKGMAFTLRVVMRKNIGSKTFSIWTLIYGYIWTRVLLVWDFEFNQWASLFEINQTPSGFTDWLELIIAYASELLDNLKRIYVISTTLVPSPLRSFMLLVYSYIFLFGALVHRYTNDNKYRKRIPRDRLNRGDSFFFAGLIDKRIPGIIPKITSFYIKIMFEPFSIIGFGILFFFYGDQQFGLFLIIGAICLLIEETREYLGWREYHEALSDQEFYYQRIDKERGEFS
jgi:hypothetical protein